MRAKVGAKQEAKVAEQDAKAARQESKVAINPSDASDAAPPKNARLACCARLLVFVVCLAGGMAFVSLGYLQRLTEWIGTLGMWGHAIIVLLLALMGLPFAWGFSVTLACAGYLYGWAAVPACEVGCLAGAMLGFALSRRTLKASVRRQIASLPSKRREQVRALLGGLTRPRAGLLLFAALRMTPLLAFGWVNGIAGALTELPAPLFALSTLLGVQMDICTRIYLGNALRHAVIAHGNFSVAQAEETEREPAAMAEEEDPLRWPLLAVQARMLLSHRGRRRRPPP